MSITELKDESLAKVASLDPKRYWALAVIGIAQLMIVLDASVVVVALPSAQHALHISVANRQWVLSAYTLAFGSLLAAWRSYRRLRGTPTSLHHRPAGLRRGQCDRRARAEPSDAL